MAIAFDNASTAGGGLVTTLKWTHTATPTSAYLTYGHAMDDLASTSSVTIGTMSMTRLATVIRTLVTCDFFGLADPPSGAITCSATFTLNAFHCVGLVGYNNTKTGAPFGNTTTATASATGAQITISSTVGSVVLAWAGTIGQAASATITYTSRIRVSASGSAAHLKAIEETAVGASTIMSFSAEVSGQSWCLFGLAYTATAAAAPSGNLPFTLPLLGVGG